MLFSLFLLVNLTACSSTNYMAAGDEQQLENSDAHQHPDSYTYSLFLVGDAGDATLDPLSGTLRAMSKKLAEVDTSGAVVFLGDNIYPDGLPPEDSGRRPEIDERLLAQIEIVKDFAGPVYFIPGNHDWASSGKDGLEYIRRQEDFVEEHMDRGNTFLPDNGYPGPVSVTLVNKDETPGMDYSIGLILMDTHWWIHPHEKPMPEGAETEDQAKEIVLNNLTEQMQQFKDDELVFSAHHPLYSFGRHGSKFPLKTHLVPPIFGSAYALYRNIWGYPQDISHKHYSRMKEGILEAASENRSTIFTAGHEHSLSFIPVEENGKQFHQIVSGSGTRYSYVRKLDGPVHTFETMGFAILRYYPDRSKRIEFYNDSGEQLFDHPFLSE
ncbi:MAG: metallophosphoesterase [Bacteroidota bacterium]